MKKVTIKAKNGYIVKYATCRSTGERVAHIYDGDEPLFRAVVADMEEYNEERTGNEMFNFCECFETVKGNRFYYWRNEEYNIDYITKVTE